MRRLIGLTALAVLGVFAISAPIASAEGVLPANGSTPALGKPIPLSEMESASVPQEQECGAFGLMCAWAGSEWNGQFSWWNNSDTGCHAHAANPKLRSFWNSTPYTVRLGGWGNLGPGLGLQMRAGDFVVGEICWPV
jgi:hypothetical protein